MNSIDWAATGAMLQGIGTWAGVAAVIIGAIIGANAWKAQKRAERRLEMAERILTATHKAKRALGSIRSIMIWGHELDAAQKQLEENEKWEWETESRKQRLRTGQAMYNRLNARRDEVGALDDCLPMARALFSEELEKAIETLRHQFWIVQCDVDAYIDDEHGTDEEFTKKIRRGMYDVSPRKGEKNEVTDTINGAVETIERICEPALRLDPLPVSEPKKKIAPPA